MLYHFPPLIIPRWRWSWGPCFWDDNCDDGCNITMITEMLYFCFTSVDLYIWRDEFYVSCSRCNISNSPGLIRVYFRIGGLPRFETNWGEKKNGICLHNESHLCKLSNFVGDYSDPHHNILVLDDSTGRRPAKKENLAEASSWYHSREFFCEELNI